MIGRQEYQPTLFSTVNIESFIPKNHLLRKLDRVLDFSFVREMTEHLYCSNNGRPSIDPELFFRIYLIIFLYGIESDRQACDEIQFNLAYRWFCKLALEDTVPDHSSLTKIRDRLGASIFLAKGMFTDLQGSVSNGQLGVESLSFVGYYWRENVSQEFNPDPKGSTFDIGRFTRDSLPSGRGRG